MRVGTSFRNTGGKLGALQDVILHPQWNPTTFDFDIAVVRICNCFDYTPAFYRVDMMPANAFLPEGTIGTVTGYGRLSVSGNISLALGHYKSAFFRSPRSSTESSRPFYRQWTCPW